MEFDCNEAYSQVRLWTLENLIDKTERRGSHTSEVKQQRQFRIRTVKIHQSQFGDLAKLDRRCHGWLINVSVDVIRVIIITTKTKVQRVFRSADLT